MTTTAYSYVYGYCPLCGAPSVARERRPNGNDRCSNGHTYPSKTALTQPVCKVTEVDLTEKRLSMIRIFCRTNLDLHNETWPFMLPAVPNVGDLIESRTLHIGRKEFRLRLQVARIIWKYKQAGTYVYGPVAEDGYYPEIELGLAEFHKLLPAPAGSDAETGSLVAFYHWYAPLVGKTVSSFI